MKVIEMQKCRAGVHRADLACPLWYQELSEKQMRAMDSLEVNLGYDIVLGTTNYTRQLLRTLGLQPIPPCSIVKNAVDLSVGNDLVFLWILWQSAYKQPTTNYTRFLLNDRLIFSSICHLNMVATISALEAILPVPPPKPQRMTSSTRVTVKKKINVDVPKGKFCSYLEKLPRPRSIGKRVFQPPKLPKFQESPYENRYRPSGKCVSQKIRTVAEPMDDGRVSRMKHDIMEAIERLYSVKETRINKLLLNLIEGSKNATLISTCGIDYIATSPVVLNNINEKAEFERLLRLYLFKASIKCCVNCLLNNSERLKHIKLDHLPKDPTPAESSTNDALSNDYDAMVLNCVHGSPNENNAQLALDLDEAAKHYLEANHGSSSEQHITLCIGNISKCDMSLWTMHSLTRSSNGDASLDMAQINFASPTDLSELLRVSLGKLRVDPRLVLPTLPNAHETPFLREWMRNRYGCKYSAEYRMKALTIDQRKWENFGRSFVRVYIPLADEVFPVPRISYDKKDFVRQRIKDMDEIYYKRFNNDFIDREQKLWSMLGPSLCTSGPPRKTFYAYMPSCEYDIVH